LGKGLIPKNDHANAVIGSPLNKVTDDPLNGLEAIMPFILPLEV
jgi:hypothetical protein